MMDALVSYAVTEARSRGRAVGEVATMRLRADNAMQDRINLKWEHSGIESSMARVFGLRYTVDRSRVSVQPGHPRFIVGWPQQEAPKAKADLSANKLRNVASRHDPRLQSS